MNYEELLHTLSQGIDFRDGEQFPHDHVLQHPEAIRALHAAVAIVRNAGSKQQTVPNTSQFQGSAWTEAEETRLIQAFHQHQKLPELAAAHGRTIGAIKSRLQRLGLI